MEYRALKSFVGLVCMKRGEVKEITDKDTTEDLLRCGFIEPVKSDSKSKTENKTEAKPAEAGEPTKRGRKPKASEG